MEARAVSKARLDASSSLYAYRQRLFSRVMRLGERQIHKADPRIAADGYAYHLAGNWGTSEAQQEMRHHERLASEAIKRCERRSEALQHSWHVADNEVGRYFWCKACQS